MGIIYFLIAILATTIGSGAGIGGGVIIKPALDALGSYNTFVIGVLSSATILAMAVIATIRCLSDKIKLDKRIISLVMGAVAGGFLGKELFAFVYSRLDNSLITTIQAAIMIALLFIALFKNKLPKLHIKNLFPAVAVGLILGTLSSFLGIGGGPINVAVLCMFFAMNIKQATTGSIFIIMFSQIAKLSTLALTNGFGAFDYSMLYYMIPGGIMGGFIGSYLKCKLQDKHIEKLFIIVVSGVILLNIYNIIMYNI